MVGKQEVMTPSMLGSVLTVIRPEFGLAKLGRERKPLLTTVIQKNDPCTLAFNALSVLTVGSGAAQA
jgi:hypothetical protein